MDGITWGFAATLFLVGGVGALVGAMKLYEWHIDQRDSAAAVTPEDKRQVVMNRLIRKYEWDRHPDPVGAACDHLRHLEDVERFRRWACERYVRTGDTLYTLRTEWLERNQRKVISGVTQKFGNDPVTVARYNAVLADALRSTPESEIFVYEPAATKWREAQRKPKATFKVQQDAIADYVAEAAFAAGNRL